MGSTILAIRKYHGDACYLFENIETLNMTMIMINKIMTFIKVFVK